MQAGLTNKTTPSQQRTLIGSLMATALLLGAMALDTKVIENGSEEDLREKAFSPDAYAQTHYPEIRDFILNKAVEASTLLSAIQQDKKAAGKQYGVAGGVGPVIPVSFTGTVGTGKSGIYKIQINGFPAQQTVRVQTGPAINGTDLRDATGTIDFGHFKNQIEYQDVGAALNRVMKQEVLSPLDTSQLGGQQIQVTGVFRLINSKSWLVTPVRLEVK